jgi:hypothetical protein
MGHAIDAGVPTLRAEQLRMRIAHLVLSETTAVVLVDEMTAGQPMVDNCPRAAQ